MVGGCIHHLHHMWAVHSPQTPLLLKLTVVVAGQRQGGEGTGGAGLQGGCLAWARSPRGSLALTIEQAPMADTEEAQPKADGQVFRVQGPSLSAMGMLLPSPGPPADNQYITGECWLSGFLRRVKAEGGGPGPKERISSSHPSHSQHSQEAHVPVPVAH